jgi:large subunit ribosomal protein L29
MSKVSEFREMSDEQLTHELRETQQELFRLRFQATTERLDAPSNLKKLRHTVARIKTIQREREIAAEAANSSP